MNTKVPSLKDQGKEYDGFTITITGDKYVCSSVVRAGGGQWRGVLTRAVSGPCVHSVCVGAASFLAIT